MITHDRNELRRWDLAQSVHCELAIYVMLFVFLHLHKEEAHFYTGIATANLIPTAF